ncbi:MAG: PTS sugar transporter subunit IIB [Bacillota bacterium]|jgi:PTS system mannose-specific IIB component|nr:PTS sugar transporter subunit IIB [Bacillota bacterium]NLP21667.1 PTS sugar transporter subunit IIB [Erysipelotrichaceae bacterium]
MTNIVLARIDDRLVHGQVMTSWLNYLKANVIVVVDDATANNPMLEIVLKSVVPHNIQFYLFTKEQAVVELAKSKKDERIILLVKYPQTLEYLINNGINISEINIGGMAINSERETVYKWLAASKDEKTSIQRMINQGIDVSIQIVAEDRKLDARDYFK